MKEEDNTERRKTRPAFLSLSCLEGKANRGTQAYQICQHDNWQREGRGKRYCTHHSAWRTALAGSRKETENRGKTRCGCSTGSQRHLLSEWKCASLLMKVYLLPIVSRASHPLMAPCLCTGYEIALEDKGSVCLLVMKGGEGYVSLTQAHHTSAISPGAAVKGLQRKLEG